MNNDFLDHDSENSSLLFQEFFAPVQNDLIDNLINEYNVHLKNIKMVHETMQKPEYNSVIDFFAHGNSEGEYSRLPYGFIARFFNVEGAIARLNSRYWDLILDRSGVLNYMPQKKRSEWQEIIREQKTPDFEESTVRTTIETLLADRPKFFAERIDGIFQALSKEHVTNVPEGFSKRMILYYVNSSYSQGHSGNINDLRCVIAKIMGHDEPQWHVTSRMINTMERGVWYDIDGGSMRMKVFKKGTAHLEVNPDIAWQLNQVLAILYPTAIPSSFRKKPVKRAKEFKTYQKPISVEVLNILSDRERLTRDSNGYVVTLRYYGARKVDSKYAITEVDNILEMIGGIKGDFGKFTFEYDPIDVIKEICFNGLIPDDKSYQFYPTPEKMAIKAVEMADIKQGDKCLEPSAGIGNIAKFMPSDVHCIELSSMRAKILKEKGYSVECTDFLKFNDKYDVVVMNPPFSQGRWLLHIEHAVKLLNEAGRVVSILPASAKGKTIVEGYKHTWSDTFVSEFERTGIDTIILKLEKE